MNLIDLLTKRMVYHLTAVVPVMPSLALQHRITIMLTISCADIHAHAPQAHAQFRLSAIVANGISGTAARAKVVS